MQPGADAGVLNPAAGCGKAIDKGVNSRSRHHRVAAQASAKPGARAEPETRSRITPRTFCYSGGRSSKLTPSNGRTRKHEIQLRISRDTNRCVRLLSMDRLPIHNRLEQEMARKPTLGKNRSGLPPVGRCRERCRSKTLEYPPSHEEQLLASSALRRSWSATKTIRKALRD